MEKRRAIVKRQAFLHDVVTGLRRSPKHIPSKWFYDERGSQLFDLLTEQEDYYPPHVERQIMDDHLDEIISAIGAEVLLIEYGSGSSAKTRTLLDQLTDLVGYVPIDISGEHLQASVAALRTDYPDLEILPVIADYTLPFDVPVTSRPARRRVVYYPGSTISNFHPDVAVEFLRSIREVCGPKGGLILGVDTKKDVATLHRAYNDRGGVTEAFNLNLLERINRELDGDFQLDRFRHEGIWNDEHGRIESHLISLADQSVTVGGEIFPFEASEPIVIEFSYKYHPEEFAELAGQAGFEVVSIWTDEDRMFTIQHLVPATS